MIYLDHAATSWPKPQSVMDACNDAFLHAGNPGRGAHEAALWSLRCMYETREVLARLFGCEPMQVTFAQNATMALNEAIAQIDGEIITTAMEHNSVLRPLHARGNYRVVLAPDGKLNAQDIIDTIGLETKAVIMTHASNLTGEIYDISKVGKACREKGILFIVDAAQTTGVVPIHMEDMCIDLLAFTGHKGLMGPTGTGGLIVGSRVRPKTFLYGGTGSQSHCLEHPKTFPDVLEAGTQNIHGIAGLGAGVRYVLDVGVDNILKHEQKLSTYFIEEISKIAGVTVYRPVCKRVGTISLNVEDVDSAQVCEWLAAAGVCVRGGAHCAPLAHEALQTSGGAVRFSFGWMTTKEDVEKAIEVFREILE